MASHDGDSFGDDIQEGTRVVAPLCLLGCCGVGIILAIILIACSVEQIPENTIAVPHNIVEVSLDLNVLTLAPSKLVVNPVCSQCYLDESAKMPGLHTKPTFGEFIMWPTTHTVPVLVANALSCCWMHQLMQHDDLVRIMILKYLGRP